VVAFTKFAKESEKTIVTLWILSAKNLFLTILLQRYGSLR